MIDGSTDRRIVSGIIFVIRNGLLAHAQQSRSALIPAEGKLGVTSDSARTCRSNPNQFLNAS